MNEIKTCPFCGSEAVIKERMSEDYYSCAGNNNINYDVVCTNKDCHMENGTDSWYDTPEDAIKSWNKRK